MRLIVMRHGQALSPAVDPECGLSEEGRRQVWAAAGRLLGLGWRPAVICHSSKARARQTAEILGEALDLAEGVAEMDGLRPEDPVGPWVERVAAETRDLALVSHLPFVDILTRALMLGAVEVVEPFGPAGVVLLERQSLGHWRLLEQF